MSDTPRTDLETADDWSGGAFAVSVAFARELECEIESLKAQLAECREKALEEAAARCEDEDVGYADRFECADEIRLLKGAKT